MRHLSVRIKIRISLGVLALSFAATLALVNRTMTSTSGYLHRASTSLFPAALDAQEAEARFNQAGQLYRNGVQTNNPGNIDSADRAMAQAIEILLRASRSLPAGSERQAEAVRIAESLARLRPAAGTAYRAMIASATPGTYTSFSSASGITRQAIACSQALEQLRLAIKGDFEVEWTTMGSWATQQRTLGRWVVALGTGWAIFCLVWMERLIVRPIQTLSMRLREIASEEADLTRRLTIDTHDELGEAGEAFNAFMDGLQVMMDEIAASAVRLTAAAAGSSHSSTDMAHHAEEQEVEAASIALQMQQMAQTGVEASQSSSVAAQKAQQAATAARESRSAVDQAIATMQSAVDSAQGSALQMRELGVGSSQIAAIAAFIREITAQTELLALNAAIEAAHAGERGSGFVIVASEMRMLSDHTDKAAAQIGEMMAAMERGTEVALTNLREGAAQVELGIKAALSTGSSLGRIVEAVEQGSAMVSRVAAAASQQASAAGQITGNLDRIAMGTRYVAESASRSAGDSAELQALATGLQGLIARFGVREPGMAARGGAETARLW